jgi:hypothetical protein
MVLSWYSGLFTTKTGRHDIAEILLKVALNTKNQSIKIKPFVADYFGFLIDTNYSAECPFKKYSILFIFTI